MLNCQMTLGKLRTKYAVVVAQLVEYLLLTPEVRSSNPVIGKLLYWTFICLLSTVLKRKNKEKEAGNGSFFKIFLEQIRA